MAHFEACFLDLDCVLCDWASAAFAACGHSYDADKYHRSGLGWDVGHAFGYSKQQLFDAVDLCGEGFWENLEPLPWLGDLVGVASSIAADVQILTAPAATSGCYSGKLKWWQRTCQELIQKPPILCKDKFYLSRRRRLLIDDSDENVDLWFENGGDAILFPQPWNENRDLHKDPMCHVRRRVLELVGA